MSRIYIATRIADIDLAEGFAGRLRRDGHIITSTWHATREDAAADKVRDRRRAICTKNHRDLAAADTLVALQHPDCRGTLVEVMAAYYRGHHVVVMGDPFDWTLMLDLAGIVWIPTETAVLDHLRVRAAA